MCEGSHTTDWSFVPLPPGLSRRFAINNVVDQQARHDTTLDTLFNNNNLKNDHASARSYCKEIALSCGGESERVSVCGFIVHHQRLIGF